MWDLPGLGLEPVSPALTSGFLTTAPPEKSLIVVLICISLILSNVEHWKILKMTKREKFSQPYIPRDNCVKHFVECFPVLPVFSLNIFIYSVYLQ